MFALGCIQSRVCNTDRCPSGVATQDPYRQRALDSEDKAQRVANFHANTLKAVASLLGTAGLKSAREFTPDHILRRTPLGQVEALSRHLFKLAPGVLQTPEAVAALDAYAPELGRFWQQANPQVWH
jgi:hypothetical protein